MALRSLLVAFVFGQLIVFGFCCSPSTDTSAPGGATTSSAAGSTTTASSAPGTTTVAGNDACKAVACDFSNDMCQYKPGGGDDTWKLTSDRSGNRDTGVPGPDQGASKYVDARPKPKGGKAVLTSGDLNNAAEVVLLIRNYESTNQMNIKACPDGNNCQDVSRLGVDASDRQYNSKTIKIPANTKHVDFVCENTGPNIGDCGLGKITVVDANGNDQCSGSSGPTAGGSAGPTGASGGASSGSGGPSAGNGGSGGSRRLAALRARKRNQQRKKQQ